MSKIIDATPIIKQLRDTAAGNGVYAPAYDCIANMLEAAPDCNAPVVHTKWRGLEFDGYADGSPVYFAWECSNCGEEHRGEENTLTRFCPNCGAMMSNYTCAEDFVI